MNSSIYCRALETRVFKKGESLKDFVIEHLRHHEIIPAEKSILCVTSKIVSLAENRLVPQGTIQKIDLVKQESDLFLGEIGYGCSLTIKDGLMIPSAGIDESNSETGEYILFPKDSFASAHRLCTDLKIHFRLRDFGVIFTDSHTTPLRQGVTGVGLSYAGFRAVKNKVGDQDLFGRSLKMTQMNLLDGLSAMAVMLMGESNESRPLAWIEGSEVEFCETANPKEIQIPWKNDLYYPLIEGLLNRSEKEPHAKTE